MNAALNELGSQLLGWFGQLSIELAALAVLVLVASRLLPIKSPALRHLLWAAVLLKPLVAVAISSPYTLFTPLASLVEPGNASALPVDHSTVQVAAYPTIATSSVRLTLAGWGAILWLVGAALLIGRILIGYGIVWRLRRQAPVQHDGPLFDALRQARRTLDYYPKVEVATSPSINSPMALGILRPIIVFPADLVEKLSADKLALVLMHELAHVRRWDNLTMLLHRLVSAVLFFHPAVWLCGRMLRREAEQACDDLVVCATGRSEAYARGLAHVAERAAHFNPLMRRIPTMNAFAATESDLALRIRRALGGGARRMGTRARVLTVVLLCPLAAVTLPSCSTTDKSTSGDLSVAKDAAEASRDEKLFIVVDQDGNMKLKTDKPVTFTTLKEKLQEKRQLLDNNTMIIIEGDERTPHGQIVHIMDIARLVELVNQAIATEPQPEANVATESSQNDGIWREAMASPPEEWSAELKADFERMLLATDPDEWSEELKAQLLALKPGSTIEEIVETVRQFKLWQEAAAIDPDEWSEELKAQLLALTPDSTIEEIAEEIRPRVEYVTRDRKEIANLFIVVDQDGNMKINNDKPVTFATLKEELQAQRQLLDNTTMIIIQGDEHATHSQIVQIMDIARQVGLVDQVIATEPQRKLTE